MGDVIDLRERKNRKTIESDETSNNPQAPVLDISDIREKMIQDERRQTKRTILNGFIGAHVVIPGRGLLKVSIFDISQAGISFDVPPEWGHFKEKEEVAMRFYFNHQVYFPFLVKVTTGRLIPLEGVFRQGAIFESDSFNGPALNHFIEFLESVSPNLKNDKGDIYITNHRV